MIQIKQAIRGKDTHNGVLDYRMSKMYGLDWYKTEANRMRELIYIDSVVSKMQDENINKNNSKTNGRH